MTEDGLVRILDGEKQDPLYTVRLCLSVGEASRIANALKRLLKKPEAQDHEHVFADDMGREISISLITSKKQTDLSGHTSAERKMFEEK